MESGIRDLPGMGSGVLIKGQYLTRDIQSDYPTYNTWNTMGIANNTEMK